MSYHSKESPMHLSRHFHTVSLLIRRFSCRLEENLMQISEHMFHCFQHDFSCHFEEHLMRLSRPMHCVSLLRGRLPLSFRRESYASCILFYWFEDDFPVILESSPIQIPIPIHHFLLLVTWFPCHIGEPLMHLQTHIHSLPLFPRRFLCHFRESLMQIRTTSVFHFFQDDERLWCIRQGPSILSYCFQDDFPISSNRIWCIFQEASIHFQCFQDELSIISKWATINRNKLKSRFIYVKKMFCIIVMNEGCSS